MDRKTFWWVTGALLGVILLAAVATFLLQMPHGYNGSVINPPSPAPDFTLTDQHGRPFELRSLRGQYVFLYFGYSHCTNECPAAMALMTQARRQLGSQADKIQVVFVATDPPRDTPEAMGTFVDRFDPSFIGVTGAAADLQAVWAKYGVTVLDGGETHSDYIYLIDPSGKLRMTYSQPITAEQISADLKQILRRA
jgi:protein SCO1/2